MSVESIKAGLKKAATKTRAELEAILARGESVLHKGQIISRIADLPSDVELAGGDLSRVAETKDALDAEIARLTALRDEAAKVQADAEAKAKEAEAQTQTPAAGDDKKGDDKKGDEANKAAQRAALASGKAADETPTK